MSESGGKTSSSSLVVVMADKQQQQQRTHRPGGCVGIFFQLLDWNRRLAKKKLFSTKLLPPARAKRATKKFGGDEKLPMAKLLLIADENRGGFPNAPKCENDSGASSRSHTDTERTREMRPPGLVARLMGLESMPERRDNNNKPKKAAFPELYHEKRSKKNDSSSTTTTFEQHYGCDREDRNLEKGHGKIESRPQKLQKTGLFERRQVTRFGAEALQLKSALSRSRKHHSKLASPVKSPRVIPGRKSTRLMGAATRILEPGLQATNRAKYALTYSSFLVNSSKEEDITTEETSVLFPEESEHQICYGSSTKSLRGQASCNGCGNLFDVMDFRSNSEEQMLRSAPSASESGSALFQGMVRSNSKPPVFPLEQGRDVSVPKTKDHSMSLSAQTKASTRPRNENCSGQRLEIQESLDQRRISSQNQHIKPRKEVTSSAVPKLKGPKQNQVSLAKDRVPSRPKMSNLRSGRDLFADSSTDRAKDFVSLNRTSSSVTRTRTSPKVLDKVDMERNACIDKHDSLSRMKVPVRKGRSTNGTTEKAGFTQPTFGKRRNDVSSAVTGKGTVGTNACSVNDNRVLRTCSGQVPGNTAGDSKNNDVVSFTFSSPMRHNAKSPSHAETIGKARSPEKVHNSSSSYKYELKRDNSCSQMETLLSGDALGALLEEKLRELTSRDRDEWESGGDGLPGRSTASILQDLISALTVGKLPSLEDKEKCLVGASQNGSRETPVGMSTPGQMFNANKKFRDTRFSDAGNSDHPSPGSVLEASFSNDSWFSDSFDDNSGSKLHPESTECSYSRRQLSLDPDTDILDSATSLNTWMPGDYEMTGDLNRMSGILYGIDFADIGVEGSELKYIKNIITNTELLLGSVPLFDANDSEDFPTVLSLVHKLENLPTCNSFMDTKEGDQLRRFLFDYVIEWLDSKYSRYCKSGFKTWQKLPLHVTGDMLTREVSEEIGKCTNLAGKLTDEIIEKDMNHNLGKWTDFGIEEFGIGTEIEWDIFESLVDEMVIELGQYKASGSSCRS